ncbi:hypothetical protein BGI41_07040 [Methanobrevibacter sp. 87.7]|uniref:DUF447 domain-containing protein n=1 Tax=Methanobrevibacter sp. 87.7 TaxID=387957 RepID=UPI000B50A568|nr:DUF447 domain-containing protein [Methanobrevibacter sp. 87.7]OWT32557.1 hypothetical protein BGI41_07040 [Methanobrevibacter sp. 87.7]
MDIDISLVGMEKGSQYETIITSLCDDGSKNAAPFGTIAYSKDELMFRIFKTSLTASNIYNRRKFIVNITNNAKIFTLSTIGKLPKEYFTDDKEAILNNCDAYLKCEVETLKEAYKKHDPVKSDGKSYIIKAKVIEIVKNKPCPQIVNRGLYMLIESLVNYTRIDIVDDKLKEYYLDRFSEDQRVIKKVGTKNDKESIEILKNVLEDKGYEIKKFEP